MGFSTLQRAEIAEIIVCVGFAGGLAGFSTLQRAEIAEIGDDCAQVLSKLTFQYSSTSRNC